jgi:hypothetical protein
VGGKGPAGEREGDEVGEGKNGGDSVEDFDREYADEEGNLGNCGADGEDLIVGARGGKNWEIRACRQGNDES